MSVIKLTHPGYPHGGTKLELDGQEVKGATGIQLNFPVDGAAECHVGVLVEMPPDGSPFEFEVPMDAHLHFHVGEGGKVIDVTTFEDKGTKLLVIRPAEEPIK